jgi:sec-independent protein translocase protein TatA
MGGSELLIVLAAVLILFGAKRIPEFAKGLGQGIKEFRKASSGVTNEFHNAMNQELPATSALKPLPSSEATAPTCHCAEILIAAAMANWRASWKKVRLSSVTSSRNSPRICSAS